MLFESNLNLTDDLNYLTLNMNSAQAEDFLIKFLNNIRCNQVASSIERFSRIKAIGYKFRGLYELHRENFIDAIDQALEKFLGNLFTREQKERIVMVFTQRSYRQYAR